MNETNIIEEKNGNKKMSWEEDRGMVDRRNPIKKEILPLQRRLILYVNYKL